MLDVKTLTDLYKHMQWADAAVWTSALASENGQTDAKLREYFYHLHLVQHAFLRLWRDEWRETPPPTFDDAQSLIEWARDYYGKIFAHLETLDDEKVSEPVPTCRGLKWWSSNWAARRRQQRFAETDASSGAAQPLSSRANQCPAARNRRSAALSRLHRMDMAGQASARLAARHTGLKTKARVK